MSYCRKTFRQYSSKVAKPLPSPNSHDEDVSTLKVTGATSPLTGLNNSIQPLSPAPTTPTAPMLNEHNSPEIENSDAIAEENLFSELQSPTCTQVFTDVHPPGTKDHTQNLSPPEPPKDTIMQSVEPSQDATTEKSLVLAAEPTVSDAFALGNNINDYINITSDEEESDGSEYIEGSERRDRELENTYRQIWALPGQISKPASNSVSKEPAIRKRKRKSDISGFCIACKWRAKRCSANSGPGPCQECIELSKVRGDHVACVYDRSFSRTREVKLGKKLPECYYSRPVVQKRTQSLSNSGVIEGEEIIDDPTAMVSAEARASRELSERPAKRLIVCVKTVDKTPFPLMTPSEEDGTADTMMQNDQWVPSPPLSVASNQISARATERAPKVNMPLEPIEVSYDPESNTGPILPTIQVRRENSNEKSSSFSGDDISKQPHVVPMESNITKVSGVDRENGPGEYAPIHELIENLKSQIEYCSKLKTIAPEGGAVCQSAEIHIARLKRNLEDRELKKHLEVEKTALSGDGVIPEWMKRGFIEQNVEDFKKKRDWSQ